MYTEQDTKINEHTLSAYTHTQSKKQSLQQV